MEMRIVYKPRGMTPSKNMNTIAPVTLFSCRCALIFSFNESINSLLKESFTGCTYMPKTKKNDNAIMITMYNNRISRDGNGAYGAIDPGTGKDAIGWNKYDIPIPPNPAR